MGIDGVTFTEVHSRRVKQLTLELLTVLVLGFLLNFLANIVFDWISNPTVLWSDTQKGLTFSVVIFTILSTYLMIRLRMPENIMRNVAQCNLLWDIKYERLIESVYHHPTGYYPQQIGFQMYEMIAKYEPELLKGLGKDATEEEILKIIDDMFEYLIFFWLGWDALKSTYRLDFEPKTIELQQILKLVSKNCIVSLATRLKEGWSPPNIIIELPDDVSLFISQYKNTNKEREITIKNQYFSIQIRYHHPMIRSISSMWVGPAPSIMGMPVNPFFLEETRKLERRLELGSLRHAFYQMVFEAKFNKWMLLRSRKFYKYMQWVEQLSDLFSDFFDWGRNIDIALKWRNDKIYDILKGIEAGMEKNHQST